MFPGSFGGFGELAGLLSRNSLTSIARRRSALCESDRLEERGDKLCEGSLGSATEGVRQAEGDGTEDTT